MAGKDLMRMEEAAMAGEERVGSVMMTVGKVLLWFAFILLSFVYVGLRSGSYMWFWWVLGQGGLGLALLVAGAHKRGSLTE
ncbi:MAG: hypothetical protein ACRD2U_12715 [Terriglobales bacterium]